MTSKHKKEVSLHVWLEKFQSIYIPGEKYTFFLTPV
jgi:hypothetical protein